MTHLDNDPLVNLATVKVTKRCFISWLQRKQHIQKYFLHLIQTVFMIQNRGVWWGIQVFTWVRTAWWSRTFSTSSKISAAAAAAVAPLQFPPALLSACPTGQSRFGLALLGHAVCPSDTLCCMNSRTPPHSLPCVPEGSDRSGRCASLLGADAASTPCSGYWMGWGGV